ncbi:MerR family transcriptional regulator [Nocardioides sp. C4-1]|uniref:MerR family transcriptional regulator n=1 Tax=Nocardioides sp. C4-1 TaxID=3151851 RepID=UPI003266919E
MNPMRSKEVADLAGVSVRTLRHYHQLGVLPEPERGSNGYRHYGLAHVATLLRIRRLTELGVPLERVPEMLDDAAPPEASSEVLLELDRRLALQVERIEAQRREIARLLDEGRRPDLPPGPSTADLVASVSPEIAALERDAGVVLAGFAGAAHAGDLRRLAEAIAAADAGGALTAITARLRDLAPDAPDDEIASVAHDYAALLDDAIGDLHASRTWQLLLAAQPGQLPSLDDDPRLNAAQLEAMRLLGEHLEA